MATFSFFKLHFPSWGIGVLLLHEITTPTDPTFEMRSKKMFGGKSKILSLFCVFRRLLLFAEWIRDTERGRDREWITLPLNKQGKKKIKKKGGCLLQEITRQDKGGLFSSILFLNSLIHAATPPPFWFIQGDSISILVPSFALPINSFLPCVGP